MARSLFTIDLAAVRHNVRVLRGALRRLGAVGGRQGRRVTGTAPTTWRERRSRKGPPHCASRPSAKRCSSGLHCRNPGFVVMGPTGTAEIPVARESRLELCVSGTRLPEHVERASEATRYGHGALGHLRAARTDARCGRVDEPFCGCRRRRGLYRRAAGPVPRGRGTARTPDAHVTNTLGRCGTPPPGSTRPQFGITLYGISPFRPAPRRTVCAPASLGVRGRTRERVAPG